MFRLVTGNVHGSKTDILEPMSQKTYLSQVLHIRSQNQISPLKMHVSC